MRSSTAPDQLAGADQLDGGVDVGLQRAVAPPAARWPSGPRRAPHAFPRPARAARGARAPWAAAIASRATTASAAATFSRAWRAAIIPMLTWSSCPAEEVIESTDAGWASDLASRDQRGRRVLHDHEAGVDPGLLDQERGQAVVERGIEQAVQPALGDRGRPSDRSGQRVHRHRHRLAVEVAAGDHLAVVAARWGCPRPSRSRSPAPPPRTPRRRGRPRGPGGRTAASRRPAPGARSPGARPGSRSPPAAAGGWPRRPTARDGGAGAAAARRTGGRCPGWPRSSWPRRCRRPWPRRGPAPGPAARRPPSPGCR